MTFLKRIYSRLPFIALLKALLAEVRQLRTIQAAQLRHTLLRDTPQFSDLKSLAPHEHQVFSQSGEDGVIREIFRRIGTTNRFFAEFGVENGLENNTHFLLQQGWTGAWIEGSENFSSQIRETFAPQIQDDRLRLLNAFVTAENICSLFEQLKIPPELDLLSIDIDGNDYWVWEKLSRWKPRVFVIEYNGHYPPDYEWIMPYDPSHSWQGTTYFGATLKSLELLGRKLGYRLVYCNFVGSNAFFVRSEIAAGHFPSEDTAEFHFQPFRPYMAIREGHAARHK